MSGMKPVGDRLGPSDDKCVPVVIAAPTGLAAYSIGGVTIHRLLMLPVEHGNTARYEKLNTENLKILRNALHGVKLIILDEVSMVSSLTLTYIHLRLCEISGIQAPFGGKNVLLFGDLCQLAPCQGSPPFVQLTQDEVNNKLEALGSVNLWRYFKYNELSVNMRQNKDQTYANLLGRVRIGELTQDDKLLLESRVVKGPSTVDHAASLYLDLKNKGEQPVCLMSTLEACRQINENLLNKLDSEMINIASIDKITNSTTSEKVIEAAKKKLNTLSKNISRTAGLGWRQI